jgi:uncharacterized protein YjcR
MTLQQISDETGVPVATIMDWKRQESLIEQPNRGVPWDNTTRLEAMKYLARNMPVAQISRKIGVPPQTIYNWKKDNELTFSRST